MKTNREDNLIKGHLTRASRRNGLIHLGKPDLKARWKRVQLSKAFQITLGHSVSLILNWREDINQGSNIETRSIFPRGGRKTGNLVSHI